MTADPFFRARHAFLSQPEEIIDEAKNGRMFILVDDEDRENEGDLVIPAQMATPDAINFMAKHGRGLICLAMCKARIEQLGLQLMSPRNGTRHETAFTVSIEARHGVTTGISAADRARTVAVAIDASKGADEIVTPGHVFPLVAQDGGVLVRAGHTEAAVDVARLAGLNPSGVICEIMKDDGTMARMDDLVVFAQLHGLKIGTIRDLIAYRRKHDHLVEQVAESRFVSVHGGEWRVISYRNKAVGSETLALIKGQLDPGRPTLVRMHQLSLFNDTLGEVSDRTGILQASMRAIEAEGSGVVVLINRQIPGAISRIIASRAGASLESPEMGELRDYGIGAQILAELGIHDMILLTNTQHTLVALAGYGLNIVGERPVGAGEQGLMARLLIVEARFYDHLNDLLLAGARAAIEAAGHGHETITVPGALEVPAAIAMAAEAGRHDGFVALGVIIRGETYHFEIVANESARGIMALTLDGLAIGNGILTVEDEAQALARARPDDKDKGGDAARAALTMMALAAKFAGRNA